MVEGSPRRLQEEKSPYVWRREEKNQTPLRQQLRDCQGPNRWGWRVHDAMPGSKNKFAENNCPMCEY